jgi:hypothetical protein
MFPAVPKAQDLPSAIQAINTLTQIIMYLAAPGLPPFQNNLATYTPAKLVGTPGIRGSQGNAGRSGGSAMSGEKGKDAEDVNWRLDRITYETVKVKNPDEEDDHVVVKRITSITFIDQTNPDSMIIFTMKAL